MIAVCLKCHISLNSGHNLRQKLLSASLPAAIAPGPPFNNALYRDRNVLTAADAERRHAVLE
jgi:hypothetical protein